MAKIKDSVPFSQKLFSKVFFHSRLFWKAVGDIETALAYSDLEKTKLEKPVFVTSLARSGTTLLLNAISLCDDVATHKYKDFPFIFTPLVWSKMNKLFFKKESAEQERFHKDGLMITRQSPEAMEEIIWSYFFADSHNPEKDNILNENVENQKFEDFYRMHLKKILLLNNGKRYASKANYHMTRILYLNKLFPEAQFVIPFRNPINHVYSLVKQHKLFLEAYKNDKFIKHYLGYAGHYEFGPDFRPSNFGCPEQTEAIIAMFAAKDYVSAYALLWNETYEYLLDILDKYPHLQSKITIVEYEEFCESTAGKLDILLDRLKLKMDNKKKLEICENTILPNYYSLDLSSAEQKNVVEVTNNVYTRLKGKSVLNEDLNHRRSRLFR